MKPKTRSLYSSDIILEDNSSSHDTMLPTDFNILVIYSDQVFTPASLPVILDYKQFKAPDGRTYYKPPIDMNQIHISRKHYYSPET